MKAVISLGGSVIGFPPNVEWLRSFRSFVEEFKDDILYIVVGGGPLARKMIKAASFFDVNKDVLDNIGIQATLLNAWLLRAALDGLVIEYPMHFQILPKFNGKIPISGGTMYPGLTTDFAAALAAEHHRVSFVNITRVGGIYDKDPERYPNAKLMRKMTYKEAAELVFSSDKREPGTNFPIDVAAFNILRRSKIRTYIVGPDIENLRKLFRGEEWIGTELVP